MEHRYEVDYPTHLHDALEIEHYFIEKVMSQANELGLKGRRLTKVAYCGFSGSSFNLWIETVEDGKPYLDSSKNRIVEP